MTSQFPNALDKLLLILLKQISGAITNKVLLLSRLHPRILRDLKLRQLAIQYLY